MFPNYVNTCYCKTKIWSLQEVWNMSSWFPSTLPLITNKGKHLLNIHWPFKYLQWTTCSSLSSVYLLGYLTFYLRISLKTLDTNLYPCYTCCKHFLLICASFLKFTVLSCNKKINVVEFHQNSFMVWTSVSGEKKNIDIPQYCLLNTHSFVFTFE